MLTISKNILGTSYDLSYDGNAYRWAYPDGHLYSKGSPLYQLFEIYEKSAPQIVSDKYVKMASYLNCGDPNFLNLIGSKFLKKLKMTVPTIYEDYESIVGKRYFETFMKTQTFLDSLESGPIDLMRFNTLSRLEKLPKSFEVEHGLLPQPVYSRSQTKTGRLTIESGPNVLTLKKEYRNILSDCRQLDYSSMEPRLLLEISGKKVDGDIYTWLAKKMGKQVTRSKAKVAVLASLYGTRTHKVIEDIFNVKYWIKELTSKCIDGKIENYFGRPISVGETSGNKLLALWLQSSAVDAALLGFKEFFDSHKEFKPHWVIHDACIFSGKGKVPDKLRIAEDIYLPVVCTGV